MNPKVSIIIPIYNAEEYLSKCLDSVLDQTYQNLEIILVDDGSTDNSSTIADNYAKKDSRIHIIHQKNRGQSSARNTGLEKATGEYISFVDCDDIITNNFIIKLLRPYLQNPKTYLSVCGLRYNWLKTKTHDDVFTSPIRPRKKNESQKAYILYLLATDGRLYSSVNKLYKKDYLEKIKFDEKLNFAEDTKFVLDYLKNIPNDAQISFILQVLYYYNYGTSGSTMGKTATNWHNWQTSYQNLKSWVGRTPSYREKFWLKAIYFRWRISHLRSKRRLKTNH